MPLLCNSTVSVGPYLGLVSEAVAWHCFAIQSQHDGELYGHNAMCKLVSRSATVCESLGCQSEVTRPNEVSESQRDVMCERKSLRPCVKTG